MPDALEMTCADVDDALAIVALRDELARWQRSVGVDQWQPGEVHPVVVGQQVLAGEWWVLRREGAVVATARVLGEDPHVWGGELGRDGTAGYLHGLMVARSAVGDGLGARVLDWFCQYALTCGRSVARLDCVADNPRLQRFYLDQGFAEHGVTDFGPTSGWQPVRRFEKRMHRNRPATDDPQVQTAAPAMSVGSALL